MVRIKFLISVILLGATLAVQAQDINRYMIFFKDKQGTGYSIDRPEEFLTERSILRRQKQDPQIDITAEDLPVTSSYVAGVRATGAVVLFKTKWMNGVLAECTNAELESIKELEFVSRTELVAPGGVPTGKRKKSAKLKISGPSDETTTGQLNMLGIYDMHEDGFRGEGMIIAVMDGGFLGVNTASYFQDMIANRFNASISYDFTSASPNVFQYSDHGTGVLSIIAAYNEAQFTGGAYKASFQLYVTEDLGTEYRVEEYNWLFAAERADSSGVDIINTSLGYSLFDEESMDYEKSDMDGNTAVITRAAQAAISKGIFMVNSAGNSGNSSWEIVTAPADGKDVLAVGNINLVGIRGITSSIGPTTDNRIKPDVVALGSTVAIVKPNGTIGYGQGTSFSAPLVTGLAAGLWQKYPELTNLELLKAIRFSASQASEPDNLLGYGIPHYQAVVNYIKTKSEDERRGLIIYPNPVKDLFTLSPKNPEIKISSLILANAQGQVIITNEARYNWPENTYTMSVANLIPGVYYLLVRVGDEYQTYKLVKI